MLSIELEPNPLGYADILATRVWSTLSQSGHILPQAGHGPTRGGRRGWRWL